MLDLIKDRAKDRVEMNNINSDPDCQEEAVRLKNKLAEFKRLYDDTGDVYPELQAVHDRYR